MNKSNFIPYAILTLLPMCSISAKETKKELTNSIFATIDHTCVGTIKKATDNFLEDSSILSEEKTEKNKTGENEIILEEATPSYDADALEENAFIAEEIIPEENIEHIEDPSISSDEEEIDEDAFIAEEIIPEENIEHIEDPSISSDEEEIDEDAFSYNETILNPAPANIDSGFLDDEMEEIIKDPLAGMDITDATGIDTMGAMDIMDITDITDATGIDTMGAMDIMDITDATGIDTMGAMDIMDITDATGIDTMGAMDITDATGIDTMGAMDITDATGIDTMGAMDTMDITDATGIDTMGAMDIMDITDATGIDTMGAMDIMDITDATGIDTMGAMDTMDACDINTFTDPSAGMDTINIQLEDFPIIFEEPIAGSEFIQHVLESYANGEFAIFLEEMQKQYIENPENIQIVASEEEMLFWEDIRNRNNENKRNFLESLQQFAHNNPLSSLGKMIQEFLCFSLTEEEKHDVYFFSESINEISTILVEDSDDFQGLWEELKAIAHNYKTKHAILNTQFISDQTHNDKLKAQHLVLDLAMKDALLSHLDSDSPLAIKLIRAFNAYLKYLGYEYNSHYLSTLLNGEREPHSENELFIKSLIQTFLDTENTIKNNQIDWIDTSCDSGYTKI